MSAVVVLAVGATLAAVLLALPGPSVRVPWAARERSGSLASGARAAGFVERRRAERRRRRAVADLPHLVGLVAVGIESGAPVSTAVVQACRAHGGEAAARLRRTAEAVAWGAEPGEAWGGLVDDPALAPLGRALARSSRTGASVVRTLAVLADDLAAEGRAAREDAARQVGVRAAVPLGVCLLPAFLLLGIVPLVAGLAASVVER